MTNKLCVVPECSKISIKRKMCENHYRRFMRHGDPTMVKRQKREPGYREVTSNGYIRVYGYKNHPKADASGRVPEHTLVMEEKLGRYLYPGENVHHKNGVKTDNTPDNLELWIVSQPAGQRPEDLVEWAKTILDRYSTSIPSL